MIQIEKLSARPIYEQIIDGVERQILLGAYPAGEQIPSVREMSVSLGINPNTIQKAYADLITRGVLLSAPGSGCFVAPDAKEKIRRAALDRRREVRSLCMELRDCGVTEEELLACVREVFLNAPELPGNEISQLANEETIDGIHCREKPDTEE